MTRLWASPSKFQARSACRLLGRVTSVIRLSLFMMSPSSRSEHVLHEDGDGDGARPEQRQHAPRLTAGAEVGGGGGDQLGNGFRHGYFPPSVCCADDCGMGTCTVRVPNASSGPTSTGSLSPART